MILNLANDAHDTRRELKAAQAALRGAADSLEAYANLQWEDEAQDGIVLNLAGLAGSVARDAATAQEAIAKAVRYALKAATVVEPRLEAARLAGPATTITRLEA